MPRPLLIHSKTAGMDGLSATDDIAGPGVPRARTAPAHTQLQRNLEKRVACNLNDGEALLADWCPE